MRLLGETIQGDWIVDERLDPTTAQTGGNFSVGYIVRHNEHGPAFLKALDYSGALSEPNTAQALQGMTEAFLHECRVLDKCGEERMSRVVKALAHGEIRLSGEQIPVSYLLFEYAEGDVRTHLDAAQAFDVAWTLRALHHVAVGLRQLHGHGIAHQDLKPSNVLVFDSDSSKLADLGRADYRGHAAPHDGLPFAGDPQYAPPELLYGSVASEWSVRRQACDMYHLGSMLLFLFTRTSTTPALHAMLNPQHHWRVWFDSYSGACQVE